MDMSRVTRCQIVNVKNNLRCKHKTRKPFLINGQYLCAQHFRCYYGDYYATYIQKMYKGYKQRRVIHNIYSKLPFDLQRKILDYTRKEHYHKKYIDTISKIVNLKVSSYLGNVPTKSYILQPIHHLNNFDYDIINKFLYLVQNLEYLSYIHHIYCKYIGVVSLENIELYEKYLYFMRNLNYIIEDGYLPSINIVNIINAFNITNSSDDLSDTDDTIINNNINIDMNDIHINIDNINDNINLYNNVYNHINTIENFL